MSDEVEQGREPAAPPGPFAPGGRHRRTLVMAAVVLVFFVVIIIVGVFRGSPEPTPRPTSSATPSSSATTGDAFSTPPLQLDSTRCAKLDGSRLTVAFGVVNTGSVPLTIDELQPTFPLGGLTPDAEGVPDVASCGSPAVGVPSRITPGGTALLAFVLTPADVRCIGPLVVDVGIDYSVENSASLGQNFHAFPDLGNFGLPSDCGSTSG